MRSLTLALLALPLFAASPASAQTATISPAEIGQIFCMSRTGNDELLLTGALSDELRTQIAYAEARNDTIATQYPDDKPPLGDGIPWQSFPDYAKTCTVGSVNVEGGTAKVVVQYDFPESPDGDFSDTLELRLAPQRYNPEAGVWRLNNVIYTNGGDLRAALDGMFTE